MKYHAMMITGCSKEEKKEENPKTEEVAKEESKGEVTTIAPEEGENVTTPEPAQTEEPQQTAPSETPQESVESSVEKPAVSGSSGKTEDTDHSSEGTTEEQPDMQESEGASQSDSDTQGVAAQVILHEGTYFAEEVYKMASGGGDGNYCEIDISNITDTSFDFTVYQVENSTTRSVIFKTHTAVFQGDGTTAVYNGKEYTLNFSFPDYHTSLPDVTDIVVTGFAPLEGETYMNNNVPGHEFG